MGTNLESFKELVMKQLGKVFTKKRIIIVACILAILLVAVLSVYSTEALEVSVDNEPIGIVSDDTIVESIIDDIKKNVESEYDTEILILNEISYEKVLLAGRSTEEEVLKERIEEKLLLNAKAYAINVDGKDITCFKDEQSAQEFLDKIKEPYISDEEDVVTVGFAENVLILQRDICPNDIGMEDVEEVFNNIFMKSEETKTYIVQKGDTVSEIGEKFELKLADIQKANPDINIDSISIGQELSLMVPRYVINVKTTFHETSEAVVPFEVEYEETDDLYKGDTKVKVAGVEGRKLVKTEIVKVNGIQDEANVIEETVTEEPKTATMLKGTKERPRTVATGKFANPTNRGRLTSRFGQRWSRQHEGIDIGAAVGTPIKAADGGKVTFAGRRGTYGRLVIINHENGFTTYYGHCNTIKVKSGQRVAKGDVIATVGNTGRSTGPHLHFEIRKNGTPLNPLKYVKY